MSSIDHRSDAVVPPRLPDAAPEPLGIGGWLLLVAFGQVAAAVGMPVRLLRNYLEPETLDLFGQFPLAMYGELALAVALFVLVLITTVQLFRKSRSFPRLFILEIIAAVLVPFLDAAWAAFAFSRPIGEMLEFEPQERSRLLVSAIGAVIWIAYILRSKRVENTFILGLSPSPPSDSDTQPPQTRFLQAILGIVIVLAMSSIVPSVGKMISTGAFDGKFVGGVVQLALAAWMSRGSNVARACLAVLYAFGAVVAGVISAMTVTHAYVIGAVMMFALMLLCAWVCWVLVFSKRFRAELAINAAKYRTPDVEESVEI